MKSYRTMLHRISITGPFCPDTNISKWFSKQSCVVPDTISHLCGLISNLLISVMESKESNDKLYNNLLKAMKYGLVSLDKGGSINEVQR